MATPDTVTRPSPAGESAAAEPGDAPRPSRRVSIRLTQFLLGSGVSTAVSQLTLLGCYGLLHAGATTATVLAFVAGAIPNFLINWFWTWARRDRPSVLKELVPYFTITISGGLLATALTTWADHLFEPHLTSHAERTVVVAVVYLGSYALFFLLKFFSLDKLMANRGRRVNAARAGHAATS